MVFKLNSTQLSQISDLLAASNDPIQNLTHPIGQAYTLLAQWADGQAGVDARSVAYRRNA